MKKIAVALAVGMVVLMSEAAKAEPRRLTASQMDEVTAGGIYVNVISLAAASGDFARALTYTRTNVVTTPWTQVGSGAAMGRALACCDSGAAVAVEALAVAGGGSVMGSTANGVESRTPRFAHAVSVVTVVVITRASPAAMLQDVQNIDLARLRLR